MKTAKQFWFDTFGKYPQNDSEELAVDMMVQYAEYVEVLLNEIRKTHENTTKPYHEPVHAPGMP